MAIGVPVIGSEISVANFGQPVADQINALIPTAWVSLPLASGWSNEGAFRPARYRKIGDEVFVEATVVGPGLGVIFTLPAGFRPLATLRIYGDSHKTGVGGLYPYRAVVDVNGNFSVEEIAGATTNITSGIVFNFSTI